MNPQTQKDLAALAILGFSAAASISLIVLIDCLAIVLAGSTLLIVALHKFGGK